MLGSMPALCVNIGSKIFFPCHFNTQGCRQMIGCRGEWSIWWWGALNLRNFLLSFRAWGIHSYFGFASDIVSQRLASRGCRSLSWFFAVSQQTFGYVIRSKCNLFCGFLILVSIIRWSISSFFNYFKNQTWVVLRSCCSRCMYRVCKSSVLVEGRA